MDTHVKVLGAVNVAFGVLGVVAALVLSLVMGGTASIVSIVGASGDPDAAIAVPIIGITGLAIVILLLALSLPSVFVGIGLLQRKRWARIAGIVLSIMSLPMIPFGTILGIYGLWVLFSKETERLFTPAATTT